MDRKPHFTGHGAKAKAKAITLNGSVSALQHSHATARDLQPVDAHLCAGRRRRAAASPIQHSVMTGPQRGLCAAASEARRSAPVPHTVTLFRAPDPRPAACGDAGSSSITRPPRRAAQ